MNIVVLLQQETGQSQQPSAWPALINMLLIIVVFYLIFYFIVIRPQGKKEKDRKKMLENLKKNDYVLTSGGLFAYVQSIKDNKVILRADEEGKVKLTVARNAIISIEKPSEEKNNVQEEK